MTKKKIEGEKPLYYSCQHGSSNTPDACFMHGSIPPTMPDDWYLSIPAGPQTLVDTATAEVTP